MMARLTSLWQHHRALLIVFVVVAGVTVGFGVRTVTSAIYWMDPAHQDQRIEGWMTPHYVADSYHLPREVVGPALFMDPAGPNQRLNLEQIAAQHGLTLTQLQDRIDTAAAAFRSGQQ